MRDATVATDDYVCERWQHCTMCGGRPAVIDQVQVQLDRLVLAAVWCRPCRNRAGGSLEPLIAHLATRYSAGKEP
jgi:hypothetical protein